MDTSLSDILYFSLIVVVAWGVYRCLKGHL